MSYNLEENVHSKDWEEGFNRGLAKGLLMQQYMHQLKDYYMILVKTPLKYWRINNE